MENQSNDQNKVLEYKGLTPEIISEITYLKVRGITKDFLVEHQRILYRCYMQIAQTKDEFSREVSTKSECCKKIGKVLDDLSPFKNKVFKTFRRPGYKLLLRKDFNFATDLLKESVNNAIEGLNVSIQMYEDYEQLASDIETNPQKYEGIATTTRKDDLNKGIQK